MKPIAIVALVALATMSGIASANCTTDRVLPATGRISLTTIFVNKAICARPGANFPGPGGAASTDRWQEFHKPGGDLIDYKKGPADKVDPTQKVGTWSIKPSENRLVHSYGGTSYSWEVRQSADQKVSFCVGGQEHVVAIVLPDQGSAMNCTGRYP